LSNVPLKQEPTYT